MPALPLDKAGPYVAGAYVAFVMLVLIYLAIISAKVSRLERELEARKKPPGAAALGSRERSHAARHGS